ncbi:uncharacterized protein LOC109717647 [Ananas comosus]|uniref:Uncharacterized protein LOC109717647 n=1 Tax=Ananas comosus TaxID=4615 RepID=A0A6P5FTW8_ANACO|nr:uncharacterized protein LOC109717647 [Ananas comosus]
MEPKVGEEEEEEGKKEGRLCVWDCGSPLYDAFELVSVSHLIDRHVMALPFVKERNASSVRFEYAVFDGRDVEAARGGRRRMKKMLVVMGRRGQKEVAKLRRKVRVRLHGAFKAIYACLFERTMKCV